MNETEINNKIQEVLYNSVKIRNLVIREIPEEDVQDIADELTTLVMNNFVLDRVIKRPTEIKDRNGKMIHFGDTMIFADKLEWYKGDYFIDILAGRMTGEEAKQKINEKPYETRKVESVEDYEWLLSSEIQSWWEVVC